MTWEKIEVFLRSQGRSDASIAYVRTRYDEEEVFEYSQRVRHLYSEIAAAFDAARVVSNVCKMCYELFDDVPHGWKHRRACSHDCECAHHDEEVWIA